VWRRIPLGLSPRGFVPARSLGVGRGASAGSVATGVSNLDVGASCFQTLELLVHAQCVRVTQGLGLGVVQE
jgi:hypothetical protein